jgi:hypothetical protein
LLLMLLLLMLLLLMLLLLMLLLVMLRCWIDLDGFSRSVINTANAAAKELNPNYGNCYGKQVSIERLLDLIIDANI